MNNVVEFPVSPSRPRYGGEPAEGARLLLFTGVRYVRDLPAASLDRDRDTRPGAPDASKVALDLAAH